MEPALVERRVLPGTVDSEPLGGGSEPWGSGTVSRDPWKIASRASAVEGRSTGSEAAATDAAEAPPGESNTQGLPARSKATDSAASDSIEAANGTGDLNPTQAADGTNALHDADRHGPGDETGSAKTECPSC